MDLDDFEFSLEFGEDLTEVKELVREDHEEKEEKPAGKEGKEQETKSIFGVNIDTNKSIYGGTKQKAKIQKDNYHDPAVAETRVFGSYSSENPMAKIYSSESTDSSNGYSTIRISMKGRRNISNMRRHVRQMAGY